MYTVTFYSFKGGVGRTSALANVAYELARRGRHVALLDFDLEAPGLSTFSLFRTENECPGIVDIVSEYRKTSEIPDVRRFLKPVALPPSVEGTVAIIPAGRRDKSYGDALAKLDLETLYAHEDGFVLFEDLKEQIRAFTNTDYLLIDSRTGYTDVAGICTRQLPDLVVLLFYPSEQNISGLEGIADAIVAENASRSKLDLEPIELEFVASNVPDVDDEDRILDKKLREARKRLSFSRLFATITHYPSMAMVEQAIFTHIRPRSRISREYIDLTDRIVSKNLGDASGAIVFLDRLLRRAPHPVMMNDSGLQGRLESVLRHHSEQPAVVFKVGLAQRQLGRLDASKRVLERIPRSASEFLMARLELADIAASLREEESAVSYLEQALELKAFTATQLSKAISLVRRLRPSLISKAMAVAKSINISTVDEATAVSTELSTSREELKVAVEIINRAMTQLELDQEERRLLLEELVYLLVGLGRFDDVNRVASDMRMKIADLSVRMAFNLAMSELGRTGKPPVDLFAHVIVQSPDVDVSRQLNSGGANYVQCLSVAHWAVGNRERASNLLDAAAEYVRAVPFDLVSCWRFLRVPPEAFLSDCSSMKAAFLGEVARPLFATNPGLFGSAQD